MSFGPISLLVPSFKSSTYKKVCLRHRRACPVKAFGEDGILNQNPILEMDYNNSFLTRDLHDIPPGVDVLR
jgi:hypothetical protein